MVPMLYLQDRLHTELQFTLFKITRNVKMTLNLFSMLFFPGLVLHELSHLITAFLLGVRTYKFRVFPEELPDGRIPLGYVAIETPDFIRGSMIGVAPLVFGGILVSYIGLKILKLDLLWDILLTVQWRHLSEQFNELYGQTPFWRWFYVMFAISTMMIPSDSDRVYWRRLISIVVGGVAIAWGAGYGSWMLENIVLPANNFLRSVAVVFGISGLVHLILLFPVVLLRKGLTRS